MNFRLIVVLFSAFLLNLIWEHLHSVLYVSYQGGVISGTVLLKAAVFDAVITAIFVFPFLRLQALRGKTWLFVLLLTLFAVGLERFALSTDRWIYANGMPLIPFLKVGLTPTIQLGSLGYLSLYLSRVGARKVFSA